MREANRIVAVILDELAGEDQARGQHPGTGPLGRTAHHSGSRASPAFKGYGGRNGVKPFPATLCTSINQEVVHGIPSAAARAAGRGYHRHRRRASFTTATTATAPAPTPVGSISAQARDLMETCQKALQLGIEQARSGNHLGDIAKAIDGCVRGRGLLTSCATCRATASAAPARGPAGAELLRRPARRQAEKPHDPGHRADDQRRHCAKCTPWTTTGRSLPATAAFRPITSIRWP